MAEEKRTHNPIDKDRITENPHNLQYPHHVGAQSVKPVNIGAVKSRAFTAMEHQTQTQLKQIYEQMELLARQAKTIQARVKLSQKIYAADVSFEPLMGQTYYLYVKNDRYVISLIGPHQWGKSMKYDAYICTCKLLADHTWDIIELAEGIDLDEEF